MKRLILFAVVVFMVLASVCYGGIGGSIVGDSQTRLLNVITHAATEAVTAGTMDGSIHVCTGAYTLSLPAAVAGMRGLFVATTAAVMTLDPNGTQYIVHDRASLGAGVTLVSDGVAYAVVCLECVVTGYWIAYVNMGTFAAGS